MNNNKKLKHAPLKEVIFEINWEENVDEFGNKSDLGFELSQGVFFESIKSEFPIHKKLHGANQRVSFGTPIHQYWKDELEWPVVQHGEGVLTINQVEANYTWEDFKALILKIVGLLNESYSKELNIIKITLEYVDAFDMDADTDKMNFIEKYLQTSVTNNYNIPGKLSNIKINRNYIQEDGSSLSINITDAVNNITNQDAVIMLTNATKEQNNLHNEFDNNLESLHDICSQVFKLILEKDFYGSLDK
jgi:uncharacterized protein (TIGR04255 family)